MHHLTLHAFPQLSVPRTLFQDFYWYVHSFKACMPSVRCEQPVTSRMRSTGSSSGCRPEPVRWSCLAGHTTSSPTGEYLWGPAQLVSTCGVQPNWWLLVGSSPTGEYLWGPALLVSTCGVQPNWLLQIRWCGVAQGQMCSDWSRKFTDFFGECRFPKKWPTGSDWSDSKFKLLHSTSNLNCTE